VNFNPSNLDIRGLAVHINRTMTVTVFRDRTVGLTNFPEPVLSNATYSLYRNGISILSDDTNVSVVLDGIKISRTFGAENQILIEILESSSRSDLCGLCGTVDGELVYSDRNTEPASIDSSLIEEFADSWRVSPQELLLGQQGEECGERNNHLCVCIS
jgi:hypothetical protein